MRVPLRRRGRLLLIGGALVALAAAAIAYASIPGPGGMISACYVKSTGTIRIIDSNAHCKSNETSITWGSIGPSGPTGPTGATGPSGPSGPAGTVATQTIQNTKARACTQQDPCGDANDGLSQTADCPPNTVALGGGAHAGGTFLNEFVLDASYPLGGPPSDSWFGAGAFMGHAETGSYTIDVWVICSAA